MGLPEEKIATVRAPAGLALGASTPEEIALSVMSQMVALRRGGSVTALDLHDRGSHVPAAATDTVIR
jgi:xanthine/CO dehydrogenase XdhC/CoxF family maturation factor